MILLKFVMIIALIYLSIYVLWKLFGKAIMRALMNKLIKRAQKDMEKQSQVYEQYVQGHSPYEESVYVEDDVKVSIRRGGTAASEKKPDISSMPIEEVEFEDID